MIKAIIFDMDGLLIDSEPLWRQAEKEIFATVGIQLDDQMCSQTMGLRTDEVVDHWFQRFPWSEPSPRDVENLLVARVRELILERGEAMPGVHDVLEQVHRAGLRIGLASSSAPPLIKAALKRLKISQFFEVTCSATMEKRGKPDPAVYLTAAQQLGVEPTECLAFEDSRAGVRSAYAAGMKVIAVPAREQQGDPAFNDAHFVESSLSEVRLKDLLP